MSGTFKEKKDHACPGARERRERDAGMQPKRKQGGQIEQGLARILSDLGKHGIFLAREVQGLT